MSCSSLKQEWTDALIYMCVQLGLHALYIMADWYMYGGRGKLCNSSKLCGTHHCHLIFHDLNCDLDYCGMDQ